MLGEWLIETLIIVCWTKILCNIELCSVWIYKVGPEGTDSFGNSQYEYAIVSDCNKYPVTVLVRNHEIFKQKFKVWFIRNTSGSYEG